MDQQGQARPESVTRRFQPSDTVDFAIVGSGAAGGIIAKELSTAGYLGGRARTGAAADGGAVRLTTSSASCRTTTSTIRRRSRRRSGPHPAETAQKGGGAHLRANGRRQQRPFHRQLLAAPPERFQ